MTNIDDKLDKVFPVARAKKKEGFVCSCERGSPRPGHVIRVPSFHAKSCHVRKKLAKESFEAGVTLNN
jgi:hypothetical protein